MSQEGSAESDMGEALVSYLPDGTVLTWGPEACRLFGYRPGEAVGRSVTEFLAPVGCLRAMLRGPR